MNFNLKRIIIFVTLIFNSPLSSYSQIQYEQSDEIKNIGKSIEFLIDTNAKLSIDNVIKAKFYKIQNSEIPNLGIIKNPVWIKLNIRNESSDPNLTLQFDQSLLESINFYYSINGKYKVSISGELYPFKYRINNYHKFIFDIKIPKDSASIYYARIESSHPIQLPLFLGNSKVIKDENLLKNIYFGVFVGIIISMFFYNLFIYFVVKDDIYLFYVVYILIVGLTQITIEGYSFQFLWPNNSYIAPRAFFILTALVNISGVEFVRRFLDTTNNLPQTTKITFGIYFIYVLTIIFTLSNINNLYWIYQLLQSFAGIVSLYIFTLSIIIAKNGYRPAKFFLVAWIPLIISIIVWILKDYNILPYNYITNYSIVYGTTLEVLLLSFALADKINIYKKEKEVSQAATLSALRENEKIISEQNSTLERKVKERTNELVATNNNLSKTLTDLKEAQTQLVEAEKMASLGQLTAGIAHEINNPINFVTSNVGPLKRDVDILVDAIVNIESLGLSDASIDEKQQQIDDYKEEIDLDYLKLEISQLINGIHEGATRTADIVKGLKIFSRLDEDDLKKADINEGINSTLTIANNLIGNKIQILRNMDDLPIIECYPGKLNQVFLNIISNAVFAIQEKFGNQTGGILKISTSYDEFYLTIKIEDNGTGMSEATKQKIFEPFFTTKNVGVGTGLGMSIVYNTIKKHNAKIYLNSTEGVGTEFVMQLNLVFTEPIADYQSEQQG